MGFQRTLLETLWAIVGLVFCMALLMLSVPRLVGSLYALYPETLLEQNELISDDLYRKAITNLDVALSWINAPSYWQNKSFCYLALYNSPTATTEEKSFALAQAQVAMEQSLALSPINPYTWYKLASARDNLGLSIESIQSAYKLSLYSGRVDPDIMTSRLEFGLLHLKTFDAETKDLWLKQIPIAYQFQADEFVQLVISNPTLKEFVFSVFLSQNEKLTQFNHDFEIAAQQALKSLH